MSSLGAGLAQGVQTQAGAVAMPSVSGIWFGTASQASSGSLRWSSQLLSPGFVLPGRGG